MLEQYCVSRTDSDYEGDDWDASGRCRWVSEPYTPPRRRITNTCELRIDDFCGWHYIIYDKYGHVQTESETYSTKAEAMKELEEDLEPRDYDNPAAPLTAVLFNVPPCVTIKGTMFKVKNGKVVKT
jgi:hypothetical protein